MRVSDPRSLISVDGITYVELRDLPYGGPFWDHEGCIGDEWPLWESLGLSRDTYDECMRWTGDSSEKARLLRRLRDELPPSITVEDSSG